MTRHRRKRTHCKRGHEMTPDNTGHAGRCRTCKLASQEAWRAQRRANMSDRELAALRHQCNVDGLTHYIQRRRARGIPQHGTHAGIPIKQFIRYLEAKETTP